MFNKLCDCRVLKTTRTEFDSFRRIVGQELKLKSVIKSIVC